MQALPNTSLQLELPFSKTKIQLPFTPSLPSFVEATCSPTIGIRNTIQGMVKLVTSPLSQRKLEFVEIKAPDGSVKLELDKISAFLKIPSTSLRVLIKNPSGQTFIKNRWQKISEKQPSSVISEQQMAKIDSVIKKEDNPEAFVKACQTYETVTLQNKVPQMPVQGVMHLRKSQTGLPVTLQVKSDGERYAIFKDIVLGVGKYKTVYQSLNLKTLEGGAYGKSVYQIGDTYSLGGQQKIKQCIACHQYEARIQKHMKDKLVVELFYATHYFSKDQKDLKVGMMMENCNGPDLNKFIMMKEVEKLTTENFLTIIEECLEATLLLKEKKVRHRDLKSENLLLNKEDENPNQNSNPWHVKLADYGLSALYVEEPKDDRFVGSPGLMAPEFILGNYKKEQGQADIKRGNELINEAQKVQKKLTNDQLTLEILKNSAQLNNSPDIQVVANVNYQRLLKDFEVNKGMMEDMKKKGNELVLRGLISLQEGTKLINNYSCDLWPIGLIIAHLLKGQLLLPIAGDISPEVFLRAMRRVTQEKLQEEINERFSGIPHPLTPYLEKFMLKILTLDYLKRPTAEQCLAEFKEIKKTILSKVDASRPISSLIVAGASSDPLPQPTLSPLPKNIPAKPLPNPKVGIKSKSSNSQLSKPTASQKKPTSPKESSKPKRHASPSTEHLVLPSPPKSAPIPIPQIQNLATTMIQNSPNPNHKKKVRQSKV